MFFLIANKNRIFITMYEYNLNGIKSVGCPAKGGAVNARSGVVKSYDVEDDMDAYCKQVKCNVYFIIAC